ncbi:MAG: DUF1097 family protein [Kiritimatiellales bacterium]|nr:DUF1097 family protein [Kiritimatiellales bacterium]
MSFKQFIVIPIFIAFQAFIMMAIAPYVPGNPHIGGGGLLTWVAFQAWAMYFMSGFPPWNDKETGPCPRMAGKTILGYIGGIIASIAIFELGKALAFLNCSAAPGGLYTAVFIVVVVVICFERIPPFNFIPAWFVGAGVYFGLMSLAGGFKPEGMGTWGWYGAVALAEIVACVVGLAFGWATVAFRVKYETKLAK